MFIAVVAVGDPSGLESIIGTLGILVFSFFLLSLAVETILENFRGILRLFGITLLQSKMSLDQALTEAVEFVPVGSQAHSRFAALVDFAKAKSGAAAVMMTRLDAIAQSLAAAADPQQKDAVIEKERAFLDGLLRPIRDAMEQSETKRIFALRIISAVVGVFITSLANFDVFAVAGITVIKSSALAYVIAGLAASGGSSFWHDQLDRVRKLKEAGSQLAALKG